MSPIALSLSHRRLAPCRTDENRTLSPGRRSVAVASRTPATAALRRDSGPSPHVSRVVGRTAFTLWRLPVGVVRIRERHRALPPDLAEVDDKLRFPVMMSDRRITGWLDCTAWLIDHPERRILVDTGESAGFGTPEYFGAAATRMGKIYPKIIDATAAHGNDLPAMVAATGHALSEIDLCVLTHTHSDHIGNLDTLARATRLLVSPEELVPAARSGRLLPKLPQDGRVAADEPDPFALDAFGR